MSTSRQRNMDKPFDPSKPVQTRDGRKARILCTDRKIRCGEDHYPIVALIEETTREELVSYCEKGNLLLRGTENRYDLVNVPEKKFEYYRMWRYGLGTYMSKSPAPSEEVARANKGFRNNSYIGILEVLNIDEKVVSTRFIPW